MDIRTPNQTTETANNAPKPNNKSSFKAGVINQASAALIIPPEVNTKLSKLSEIYGLPINLSQISLTDTTPENIKSTRQAIDLISNNSKLLPELLSLCKQLLQAEIKLAEFHKKLTKAAINHQEKIDKATADIFLSMAGYRAKGTKTEHRVNTRNQLIEKRTQAYADYNQNSIYGNAAQVIDVEYEIAANNHKILTESKTQKVKFKAEQKKKAQEYISKAFAQ